MVGDVARDPLLFERVRSLFSAATSVVASEETRLDERSVLSPRRADTAYIWIRVSPLGAAQVYLTLAARGEKARYLLREVGLDSGLDEVGSETLAEVAHSSAQALWRHEQQSSRQTLVDALQRAEPSSPPPATPPAPTATIGVAPAARDDSPPSRHSRPRPEVLRLGIGAMGTLHGAGDEGWRQEWGAIVALEYRGWLSLRTAARYLVPTDFGVPPARVHLSGGAGELRAGWLSAPATRMRVRLEAGLGALLLGTSATITDAQPKAHALGATDFLRGYALGALGVEWPIGPAWVATGFDVRFPISSTSYEVAGETGRATSPWWDPGASLEIGFGFDPSPR
jgi:hypothetical protein